MFLDDLQNSIETLSKKLDILIDANFTVANPPKEWLTKEEVMEMLDCSERTLQHYRDIGLLHYSRLVDNGRIFLYKREDVLRLLESKYSGKT